MRYAVQGVDGCESMDELAPPEQTPMAPPGEPPTAAQRALVRQSEHPKACPTGPTATQTGPRYILCWSPALPPLPGLQVSPLHPPGIPWG